MTSSKIPLFSCNSEFRQISSEITEEELKFLTDFSVENISTDCILFGHRVDLLTFRSDPSLAFDLIRMYVNKLENESEKILNSFGVISSKFSSSDFQNWQFEISQFFDFIISFLSSLQENEARKILFELKGLLIDVGHLRNIPLPKTGVSKILNATSVYFHVCLEIWWKSLKIYYIISRNWPNVIDSCDGEFVRNLDSGDVIDTKLTSFVKILVSDLCLLDNQSYQSNETWFPCSCVVTFWSILKSFADELWTKEKRRVCSSFSSVLRSVLNQIISERQIDASTMEIRSDQFLLPEPFQLLNINEDKNLFYWKLTNNLQRLNVELSLDENVLNYAVELVVKTSVVNILNEQHLSIDGEQKIRRYLNLYLQMAANYRCVSSVPEIILDSFCRHLNETFYGGGGTLDELSVDENASAERALREIKQLTTVVDGDWRTKTSFELFLRILATHCGADEKLSKSIRGRCFSKFSPGRVKNLSVRGLMNFFDLFLTLAYRTGLKEVADEVVEFVSEIDLNVSNVLDKLKTITKSYVVLTMMFQERRVDDGATVCTSKLRLIFDCLLNQYSSSRLDTAVRRDIWSAILFYVRLIGELFANANEFNCGELQLLDVVDLNSLMKCAKLVDDVKISHLMLIFNFWCTIADRANSFAVQICNSTTTSAVVVYPEALKNVYDVVCTKITPVAKLFVLGGGDSNSAADLWYSLTMSTYLRRKSNILNQEVVELIDGYVWNASVNGSNATKYVAKLLVDVNLELAKVVSIWLRCSLTVVGRDPTFQLLTEFVYKQYLTPVYSFPSPDGVEISDVFKSFCETVASKSNFQTISVWRSILEQPTKFGVEILKNLNDSTNASEIFLHCNSCLAVLVEHCAYVLHRRDDPRSSLKAILDQTTLFNGKVTSTNEREIKFRSINVAFARIIRGITKQSYWQTDSFLKNSLYESYKLAFERTATLDSCNTAAFNVSCLLDPLKETLNEPFLDLRSNSCLFRQYCVVKSICDLLDRICVSKNILNAVLTFYSNLYDKTNDPRLAVDESKLILPKLFVVWFRVDDSLTSLFVDIVVDTICSRLVRMDGGEAVFKDVFKRFLREHLRQASEKVVRILKNICRNATIRTTIDLKTLYSCELVEIDRMSGGSLNPKLWSVFDDL